MSSLPKGFALHQITDDFKKEDLARAVLHLLSIDLAQMFYLIAKGSDIKTVFLSGGFGNSVMVREMFTEEFLIRSIYRGEVGLMHIHNFIVSPNTYDYNFM